MDELQLLKDSYSRALQKCIDNARAAGDRRSVLALNKIASCAEFVLHDYFNMNWKRPGLLQRLFGKKYSTKIIFGGPKGRIADCQDTIDTTCAHEIKHALLKVQAYDYGRFNIARVRGWLNTPDILSFYQLGQKAGKWLKKQHCGSDLGAELRDFATATVRGLGLLFSPLYWLKTALRRIEEFSCDKYALTQFPETDLEKWRRSRYKRLVNENNTPEEVAAYKARSEISPSFELRLEDIFYCRTHPNVERRYRRLEAQRKEMKPL